MATIIVTPQARRDVDDAIAMRGLPTDTWARIARSVRVLEQFPLAGRALEARWRAARFLLGAWPWMIIVYAYDEGRDTVAIVAAHDARSSTASRAKT